MNTQGMEDSYLNDQNNSALQNWSSESLGDLQFDALQINGENSIMNDQVQLKKIDDDIFQKLDQDANLMEQLDQGQQTKNQTNIRHQYFPTLIEKNQSSPSSEKRKKDKKGALNQAQEQMKSRKSILKNTKKNGITFFRDLILDFEKKLPQKLRLSVQGKNHLKKLFDKPSSYKIDQLFKLQGQIEILLSRLFANKNIQRQILLSRYKGKGKKDHISKIYKKKIFAQLFKKCFCQKQFYSITSYKNSA